MLESSQPIEGRRGDRFRPPHCPWPECPDHTVTSGYRCIRKATYRRKREPNRKVQRFRCSTCERTFSRDAFAVTYRLRRPELLPDVANLMVSGSANRQIARQLGCSHSTVMRLGIRLGEHAELFQLYLLSHLESIAEPIVLDHFETFARSQPERLAIATSVGQISWFIYALKGAAYLRLKGRSARKRALRSHPRVPEPGEVVRSTLESLQILTRKTSGRLTLITDAHPAYPIAVRQLGDEVRHRVFPNPDRSTPEARRAASIRDREMFAVDLCHKILRHSQAHHRRETIAFGRKRANILGRAAIFAVWRNVIKLVTERRPTDLTPAMRIGLTSRRWSWRDVLARRYFAERTAERPE